MTRSMADATAVNYLAAIGAGTGLVADYVTGDPTIRWTDAMRGAALIAGKTLVSIDQGFTGSPVPSATVRDVERGAWTVAGAVSTQPWSPPRPTIYLSVSVLPQLAAVWAGDVWVALYDGIPELNFPVPAGMNVVAKQYLSLPAYDLSVVFDPTWPELPAIPTGEDVELGQYTTPGATVQVVAVTGADQQVYALEQLPGGWVKTGNPAGGPVPLPLPVDVRLQVVADVPQLFIQCTDPKAADNGDVYTSSKQTDGTWSVWAKL